jgi:hypothetical protein
MNITDILGHKLSIGDICIIPIKNNFRQYQFLGYTKSKKAKCVECMYEDNMRLYGKVRYFELREYINASKSINQVLL